MNLLAIDTSAAQSAVALSRDDGRIWVIEPEPGPKHGRLIVPAIRDLLASASVRAADLHAIAVAVGPGSFTGLRVGVTAAKTLAFAAGCPIVPLSSLEVLARNAPEDALWVVPALDAQRGDLFSATFRRDLPGGPLLREHPDRIIPAASWASSLPPGSSVVCPTPDRISSTLPSHASFLSADLARPLGSVLLSLASDAFSHGLLADPWSLEPLYLRRSAAEEKRDLLPP